MALVPGKVKAASGRAFGRPQEMSIEEMQAEIERIMAHDQELRSRPQCKRNRCDGLPHVGYPYPHEPKRPAGRTPMVEAKFLDKTYQSRPHLQHLSSRLTQAVKDVEGGTTRFLTVSMPPRMGKSQLTSVFLPIWLLHKHPSWKIGLISHSPTLATNWGRQVRRVIEQFESDIGVKLAPDAGAVADWETTEGGRVVSRSAPGQSITGFGFDVMLIDDPVKDFADAHSKTSRDAIWDWWTANAFTRLEPPALVVVVGTRWHEDDFIGRLLSREYDGDPDEWEVIKFPAIAEEHDVLGRVPGQPLLSPIVEENDDQAIQRWEGLKRAVGSYTWSALYQQRPAPAQGAIFENDWWRYWTTDPSLADGEKTILLPTSKDHELGDIATGQWLDSWDMTFKGGDSSDYVVGQRWVRKGANRFLIAQARGRWTFTETIEALRRWAKSDPVLSPYGERVHRILIEDAANGPAIMDTLRKEIAGITPIQARVSKESRARAVTPEIESGNVFLPHPSQTGYGWVTDLVGEFREFPHGAHDDQVDATTQALMGLRSDKGGGAIAVPQGNRGSSTERARNASRVPSSSLLTRSRVPGRQAR